MAEKHPTQTRQPAPAGAAAQPAVSRWIGVLMLADAITFGIASYLHLDGRIPLGFATVTGENFRGAAIPEAVIGAVLAAAAALVLAGRARARPIALAATVFAIIGTAYGLTVVLRGGGQRTADLAYHSAIMAALLVTFWLLLRSGGGRAPASEPGSPR
ncbi:MAG TPA: hypothetical protein VH641_06355 [Streptosporangiaceae bacterium]